MTSLGFQFSTTFKLPIMSKNHYLKVFQEKLLKSGCRTQEIGLKLKHESNNRYVLILQSNQEEMFRKAEATLSYFINYQYCHTNLERIYVDLGNHIEPRFFLEDRLKGKDDEYLKHIEKKTNCKLEIRGRGTEFDEHLPIHVAISSQNHTEDIPKAVKLVQSLITKVQKDYKEFVERKLSTTIQLREDNGQDDLEDFVPTIYKSLSADSENSVNKEDLRQKIWDTLFFEFSSKEE